MQRHLRLGAPLAFGALAQVTIGDLDVARLEARVNLQLFVLKRAGLGVLPGKLLRGHRRLEWNRLPYCDVFC